MQDTDKEDKPLTIPDVIEQAKNFTPPSSSNATAPSRGVKRIRNYEALQNLRDQATSFVRLPSSPKPINQRIRFRPRATTTSTDRTTKQTYVVNRNRYKNIWYTKTRLNPFRKNLRSTTTTENTPVDTEVTSTTETVPEIETTPKAKQSFIRWKPASAFKVKRVNSSLVDPTRTKEVKPKQIEQPTFMKQKLNLLKKIYVTRPTFAVMSSTTTRQTLTKDVPAKPKQVPVIQSQEQEERILDLVFGTTKITTTTIRPTQTTTPTTTTTTPPATTTTTTITKTTATSTRMPTTTMRKGTTETSAPVIFVTKPSATTGMCVIRPKTPKNPKDPQRAKKPTFLSVII